MENNENNVETLMNLGFQELSTWQHLEENLTYSPQNIASSMRPLLDVKSALYAFIQDGQVKYIGKTANSIRKRFFGYCNPGKTKATNRRCFDQIKTGLSQAIPTQILIFAPIAHLQYQQFSIDLAAGLENSLISYINPPWNGGGSRKITEEAERELEESKIYEAESKILPENEIGNHENLSLKNLIVDFKIVLKSTYWSQGFINPGVAVSKRIGRDGEAIRIDLGNDGNFTISKINRTANSNRSPRFIGGNREIAEWFKKNFKQGDVVEASIIDANHVFLHSPKV
jgi:hypothetical protein